VITKELTMDPSSKANIVHQASLIGPTVGEVLQRPHV